MASLLITGAAGRMAKALRPSLLEDFDNVRLYSRSEPAWVAAGEEALCGELEDLESLERACSGIDVIVHLGGVADEAPFSEIMSSNILGTYNVFEAARRCGVRRVVYASSHHVTGFHPVTDLVSETSDVRPDTLYGVSKVFGEALGRLYHDKWALEVICLRIGVCREAPENSDQLRTWLSVPDSVRLVRAATTQPLDGGFLVAYGVSDNTRRFWDSRSSSQIGFTARDSADDFADELGREKEFSTSWQGASFTSVDYSGGTW
jgi:uronate dehydrogenase